MKCFKHIVLATWTLNLLKIASQSIFQRFSLLIFFQMYLSKKKLILTDFKTL